ncbi:CotO family spore coat protein [Virgibacillus byunsanensis]|uniref:CotO family spore coat protein n=1 Tax=Virgibacillus byunsanensis TaxID=570945 RepID=A0ABW3LT48_9BACI
MGKKRFAKEPLLYIHQPSVKQPKAPMQHHYTTPKKTSESAALDQPVKKQPRPLRRDSFTKPTAENSTSTKEPENKETKSEEKVTDVSGEKEDDEQEKTRPKFKDMTLHEKVDYFTKSPVHVPKVKCEVKTDTKSHRGIIIDFKDGEVMMRVGKRTSTTKIPFDTITEIRMLGF